MRGQLQFLDAWASDMKATLEKHPEILNPNASTRCIHLLFETGTQRRYTGFTQSLKQLPQVAAPLVVWFLVVFLLQYKLKQLSGDKGLVIEELTEDFVLEFPTMSSKTKRKYSRCHLTAVSFD